MARAIDNPNAPFPLLFISFPSAKDPTFAECHPGRATAEIVVPAPFEWFKLWANTRWQHRRAAYDALKARLTERLLAEFAVQMPGRVATSHTPNSRQRISWATLGRDLRHE